MAVYLLDAALELADVGDPPARPKLLEVLPCGLSLLHAGDEGQQLLATNTHTDYIKPAKTVLTTFGYDWQIKVTLC